MPEGWTEHPEIVSFVSFAQSGIVTPLTVLEPGRWRVTESVKNDSTYTTARALYGESTVRLSSGRLVARLFDVHEAVYVIDTPPAVSL